MLAAAGAVGLSACGGSGSAATASFAHESAKPAGQILAGVCSVVGAATSVHLAGHVGGQTPVAVDLHLSRRGGYDRPVRSGRSITALVLLGIVLLVAGFLVGVMIFAHIVGRTTSIPPRAEPAA